MAMTSRQRVRTALSHKEPDRVPVDFGATRSTGINALAYSALRKHLGMAGDPVRVYDLKQLLALPDADMLALFHSDCVQLHRMAPSAGLDIRAWKPEKLMDGDLYLVPENYHPVRLGDGSDTIVDAAGQVQLRRPAGGMYFDDVATPFADVGDEADLARMPYPSLSEAEAVYLRAESIRLSEASEAAVVAPLGISLFEKGIKDFGYEEWLVRIMTEESLVIAYLERLTDAYLSLIDRYLDAVGLRIDVLQTNDDLGMQTGMLLPPEIYRRVFKPFHKILFERIHKKAPHAFLLLHSCGSIRDIIPDLIEAGVDALNPVQINASGMEPAALKRDFGRDITFWGGAISTQTTLPFGSLSEVEAEVRRNMDLFAPGGGFVFAPVHNIQSGVSPEKIIRVYETAWHHGGRRSGT